VISITQVLYPNVTTDSRLAKCTEFMNIKADQLSKSLKVKDLQVMALGTVRSFYMYKPLRME